MQGKDGACLCAEAVAQASLAREVAEWCKRVCMPAQLSQLQVLRLRTPLSVEVLASMLPGPRCASVT